MKTLYYFLGIYFVVIVWCSPGDKVETSTPKTTEDDKDIKNIMSMIQETCPIGNSGKTMKQLETETDAILENGMKVFQRDCIFCRSGKRFNTYKRMVEKKQRIHEEIKLIIKESKEHGGFKSLTINLRPDLKDICTPVRFRDCSELHKKTEKGSGVYTIYPDQSTGSKGVEADCDMQTDKGGWTVIQRRINGSVNFERGWTEYENGFGNANGEYWLGNKYIHLLTSKSGNKLRIDLVDTSGNEKLAEYNTFIVGGAEAKYNLTVGGYSGNAGDGLAYQNGMKFTTIDQDNDVWSKNCALDNENGAWWLRDCAYSYLNRKDHSKLYWKGNFKKSTMIIRTL